MEDSAKLSPSIHGPPYHHECVIETKERNQGLPFPETFIGRIPLEIREMIYAAALDSVAPLPNSISAPIQIQAFKNHCWARSLWSPARKASRELYRMEQQYLRHIDDEEDTSSVTQKRSALRASYPPFAAPYPRLKFPLLLTCRQIYEEAWSYRVQPESTLCKCKYYHGVRSGRLLY